MIFNKRMKENLLQKSTQNLLMCAIVTMVILATATANASSQSVYSETLTILGKSVKVVTVDFNNPNIRFDVVKGNNQHAGWEDFKSILDRTKPIAAVNGNYFNAYAGIESEIVPWGYIFKDGEMINSGSNRGSFAVTYDRKIMIDHGEPFSKENIQTMVEAGPLLIKNGVIVFNPDNNQYFLNDNNINRNSAQRSAIGVRPNEQVVMVTGSNLRMTELAEIMKELGCIAATNLDGGASSALYANGSILTSPGRKLNTVLVVYNDEPVDTPSSNKHHIKVLIDNEFLSMEVPPAIVNGRTMVPLRSIFRQLGVDILWNDETRTITAATEDNEMTLTIGHPTAVVNGASIQLDTPGTIIEGRTLVPIRFIAESLGAEVRWIGETRTVIINTVR